MAENSGRRIGCLVGCIALALLGVGGLVVVGAGGVLLAAGAGSASYFMLARDAAPAPVPIEASHGDVPDVPVPVVAVPPPEVDGTPEADGANEADMAGAEDDAGDGTEGPPGTGDVPYTAPEPEPSGIAEPAPTPTPAPTTSPAPTPRPTPTPSPVTAAAGGKITVEGAASVVLIGDDGSRTTLPGTVPSGSYTMEATFSDGVPVNVGKITVLDGGSHVVRCNENMGICRGS